jgi:hypothetical protein
MRSALSRRCATNAAVGQARESRNSNYGNIGVGAGAAATICLFTTISLPPLSPIERRRGVGGGQTAVRPLFTDRQTNNFRVK